MKTSNVQFFNLLSLIGIKFSLHDDLEIPINNCQSIFDTEFLGVMSFQKLIAINSKIELVLKPFIKLQ